MRPIFIVPMRIAGALVLVAGVVIFGARDSFGADVGGFDKDRELSRLVSGTVEQKRNAMRQLAQSGDDAVPEILDIALKNGDKATKARAMATARRILKRTRKLNEQAFAALDQMSADSDYAVAQGAVSIAAIVKSERTHNLLRNSSKNHPDERIRGSAISSLLFATAKNQGEAATYRRALTDPSELVVMRAAGALGQAGSADGLDKVLTVLSRAPDWKSWGILAEAAASAGDIGDARAVPVLEKVAASDSYGPARGRAAEAIQQIKLKQIAAPARRLEFLRKALADHMVASWAAYELKAIGTPQATAILKSVASDSTHPGRSEAGRALEKAESDD